MGGCVQSKQNLNKRHTALPTSRQNRNAVLSTGSPERLEHCVTSTRSPSTHAIRGAIHQKEIEPVTPVTMPNFRPKTGRLDAHYDSTFCADSYCDSFATDLSLSEALERSRRARALFFRPVEHSFHKFKFTTPKSDDDDDEAIEDTSAEFSIDIEEENNNKNQLNEFKIENGTSDDDVQSIQQFSSSQLTNQTDNVNSSANVLSQPLTPQSQHLIDSLDIVSQTSIKSDNQNSQTPFVSPENASYRFDINIKVKQCIYRSSNSVPSEPIEMNFKHISSTSLRFTIKQATASSSNEIEENSFLIKKGDSQSSASYSQAQSGMFDNSNVYKLKKIAESCPDLELAEYCSRRTTTNKSEFDVQQLNPCIIRSHEPLTPQSEQYNDSLQPAEHFENILPEITESQQESADEASQLSSNVSNGEESSESKTCNRRQSRVSFRADTNFEPNLVLNRKSVQSYTQSSDLLIRSESSEINQSERKSCDKMKKKSLVASLTNQFDCTASCCKSKKQKNT